MRQVQHVGGLLEPFCEFIACEKPLRRDEECGESRRVWDMAQRPERRPAGSRLHWKRCGLPIGVL